MLQFDFEQSLGWWVITTGHALQRALNAELSKEGITVRQWEVLAWIALEGEMSQTELAERLGIEAPTLVGILDRMERDGWLDRYHCPNDRRKKRIRVTAKVELVWSQMVACAHRVRSRASRGMTPEELSQFKLWCTQIRKNVEAGDRIDLREHERQGQTVDGEAPLASPAASISSSEPTS